VHSFREGSRSFVVLVVGGAFGALALVDLAMSSQV
jgi:UDP-N-acetylglucosamine:LPS N-acetylglucosamine transferase